MHLAAPAAQILLIFSSSALPFAQPVTIVAVYKLSFFGLPQLLPYHVHRTRICRCIAHYMQHGLILYTQEASTSAHINAKVFF